MQIKVGIRSSVADIRLVAEQVLGYRRPIAILLDEAQHLSKIASGRKLQDQLDALKSLSNQTSTIIVLLGTYELLAFRNLSAQLSRRSIDIHFQRYHLDSEESLSTFQSALMTFQHHLPLNEEPDLVARWDYFYERSIGCVGVLKEWLSRSLTEALADGGKRLTLKHCEKYALSLSQCEKMLSDAKEGEMRFNETDEAQHRLRANLGLIDSGTGDGVTGKGADPRKFRISTIDTPKRTRRIGRRKPKRDPIAD